MRDTPKPGHAVRGSRTGRPIMALLDLLGHRWTLRILWELRDASLTFRALQEACGRISAAALVSLDPGLGYGLSPLGRELVERFVPLVAWSERWARELR
jgi:DNA-binding HxlR family transcriptional regulator